jgi:hypothetical protein
MPFPVDGRWITATEAKLGVRFPASFVTTMSKHNGGAVAISQGTAAHDEFSLHPFFDGSDRTRIKRTTSSIDRETTWARANIYEFPPAAVVIGANGGGDLLVLLPMDDDATTLQHTVYRFNHEAGETEPIADDFSDLSKS